MKLKRHTSSSTGAGRGRGTGRGTGTCHDDASDLCDRIQQRETNKEKQVSALSQEEWGLVNKFILFEL